MCIYLIFFQFEDTKTIDRDIATVLSIDPCYGSLHYESEHCNCSSFQVFLKKNWQ